MADESSMVQAVPKSLQLDAGKPTSIPAYIRKVKSVATNAQTFSENSFSNIMLDTSTAGSFLDCQYSLLQFDLTITNTNPYVDYINFSAAGAAALIQEFRVYCQGTPIEEILDYNMMFEMWMDLQGSAQEEFKMFCENPRRAPVAPGGTDLNFVKPPMVDREGIIMCPNNLNTFGSAVNNLPRNQGGYFMNCNTGSATNLGLAANIVTNFHYGINRYRRPAAASSLDTATAGTNALASTVASNFIHSFYNDTIDKNGVANGAPRDDARNACAIAPGTIRSQCWTNRIDNTYVTWPTTIRPLNKMEKEEMLSREQGYRKYRLQDYIYFLANVKNIPVGISPAKSFASSDTACWNRVSINTMDWPSTDMDPATWNFLPLSSHMTGSATISFEICLPIFSGLLGIWATKMFPTCLIAPGSLYIQVKWAKAVQAFQTAMDPCRRVFGTYRDYMISWGLPFGYATEQAGNILNAANRNTILGPTTFSNNVPSSCFLAITPNGANGWDYAYNPWLYTASNPTTGVNTLTDSEFQVTGNYAGFGEGLSTGNAKPQYVPIDQPWLWGGGWQNYSGTHISQATTYVKETGIVYGTYLSCSTAQGRRCWVDQYNAYLSSTPPNSTIATGKISFTIANLYYTGLQVVLPDEMTGNVVRAAAQGLMDLYAHTVHTYRALTSQSYNQNIILPIKVASANSLFILFQNANMNENPYYLGCTRSCPLTSYTWNTSNNTYESCFVGSNVAPIVQSVNALNPFSIQLRIGNEYLPIQPITDIPTLLGELEKSMHYTSDITRSIPTLLFSRPSRSTNNNSIANSISGGSSTTEYNFLETNGFLTPYIPVDALDDQTITNNPQLLDLPATTSTTNNIVTMETLCLNTSQTLRGAYVFNDFLPPVSKFMLGFDLEKFSNQSAKLRAGKYLGNGTITLQMTNCFACNTKSVSTNASPDSYNVICVVWHDIRFNIGRGGQVLAFY